MGESVATIMAGTKVKKGFSFTIDSLINSKIDNHPIKTDFNAVFRPEASTYSRSSIPSCSPVLNYERTDEEFSEYCDTSGRICQILAPQSCIATSEFDREVIQQSSPQLHQEHSHQNAVTRHKKKARTAFTNEQLDQLEKQFHLQRYLAANERSDLAEELKLTNQQVKTWFQNRRMKEKRQQKLEQTSTIPFPTGGVDVRNLHAPGIPCHILSGLVRMPSYQSPVFPSKNLHASTHIMSHMNSPYVPPSSQTMSGIMHHFPYYGHQCGFRQLPIPHNIPTYCKL